mmetsp:Transcript_32118/g.64980  ORF Transcript_32118/g.64980 Transcript_32118/m.64980 type:complete len:132 (+) Transcript_32118:3864-4259(+)
MGLYFADRSDASKSNHISCRGSNDEIIVYPSDASVECCWLRGKKGQSIELRTSHDNKSTVESSEIRFRQLTFCTVDMSTSSKRMSLPLMNHNRTKFLPTSTSVFAAVVNRTSSVSVACVSVDAIMTSLSTS